MSDVLFITTNKLIKQHDLVKIKKIFDLKENGEYSYFRSFENIEQQNYFGNENVEFGYWGKYENANGYTYYFDSMFILLQQPLNNFQNNENFDEFANVFYTAKKTIRYLIDNEYEIKMFISGVETVQYSELSVTKNIKFEQINADTKLDYRTIYNIYK